MEELNLIGFKQYLQKINFRSVNNYVAYIKTLLKILDKIDKYEYLSSIEKIVEFSSIDNEFKEEFNKYHEYASDDTFNDLRSGARKYVEFLKKKGKPFINQINTKNIILYGPPGVGKTYNHKKLISLIESGTNQKEIFDAIRSNELDYDKTLFKTIQEENRFKFVTFHQSYSYEDFIEGFRPHEDGNIKLEDGIFKEIAEEASKNLSESDTTEHILDFENILEQFQIECEIGTVLKTVQGKEFEILDYTSKSIRIGVNDNKYSISHAPLKKIFLENKNLKIERPLDIVHALDGSFKGLSTYYYSIFKKLLKYEVREIQNQPQKNYYLLIDEINRGNISKIFGELITLIEDDKRDEIEITLPYSKEAFKVPSNLYIIATMNSTDKSIALIDVALRRRFTFLKMEPDDLLVHEEIRERFNKLNQFIKEKIGKDYLIGHSYFDIHKELDLDFVLEYKIKPLLEEYFYSDEEGLKEALEIIG